MSAKTEVTANTLATQRVVKKVVSFIIREDFLSYLGGVGHIMWPILPTVISLTEI